MEDSYRAGGNLKSELGLDSQVVFRTFNGHTTVTVRLLKPPAGDAAKAKEQITEIVNKSFRGKVERVDVVF